MEYLMLEIVADEVKLGNKSTNQFKVSSFNHVSNSINKQLGMDCSSKHVENHLKIIRSTWSIIQTLLNKSSLEWDDNLEMITASPEVYSVHIQFTVMQATMLLMDSMALISPKVLKNPTFIPESEGTISCGIAGCSTMPLGVAAIIEKLPPMWKDFKNYLKHKHKEMAVKDLIVRLCIEEDNKATERRLKGNSKINGEHIIEDDQNNSKKRKKAEQGSHQPKKKFKGKSFNCGKIGYMPMDCCAPNKGKKKDQENIIEYNKDCDDLCSMFSECNLAGNPREGWTDSGATRHVCANKEFVLLFAPNQVEEMIYMDNSITVKVEGTGKWA
ncbi:hypothetical protein CQW23_14638 [Capsicum baccatum]|uniref:Myb/SANT-like domain-containing protein n=1 Tax=Capsicum baccatum TaxID=33114 RepID=A0A2G2WK04_CAPBA|nr:hypothetical protein CQW23_14638 [Capsicum baccatum]